jgi:hypothetical protein
MVGIGLAIGVEHLKTDTDTDSNPDTDFGPIVAGYSIRLRPRRGLLVSAMSMSGIKKGGELFALPPFFVGSCEACYLMNSIS